MKNVYFSIICIFLISASVFGNHSTDSIQKWSIKGKFTFLFNQSAFSNWTSGGDNTIAGNVNINYDFNYKKGKWNWDNKIITGYGLSHVDDKGFRKTNDQFEYNSLLGLKSKGLWFFSFFNNITTQFTRGYDYSETPAKPTSTFFSPAYISFGPGLLWKKSDDYRINIAPATSRFTFVSEEFSGKYGVDVGETNSYSLGFNLSTYMKFDLMENINMENIVAIYSDYLNHPENIDVNYQMNLLFKVNRYFSMNMTLHAIVDDNTSKRIQFREVFGLGLSYFFQK
ncbi:DUF3078 domain-containing protein [Tenacibaculum sp. 1_MG-2023]|uniref:DUF3078 domain-containing protein n=1 Tax=Tenacibaculum sp. 1_MG-2023 TaxID=3062653 RepID=UPI0026E39A6D|nr:DUF3078 domain-containing protein [Tenacibaculum sp. 1_MG-2023]MDO6599126.1 DUF3078 domain-containing protein [Tenacibaculum sp. 1_MG-2023]